MPPEFGQEFDFPVNSALNLAKIAFPGRLMVHKKTIKQRGCAEFLSNFTNFRIINLVVMKINIK